MKKIYVLLSFLLVSCCTIVNAQENVTLDAVQIIKKTVDAMGGETYLKSVKTMYSKIKTEMEGRKVTWIVKEMLPNKGSFMIEYQERTVYKTWFDGKDGYEMNGGVVQKADPKTFEDKAYKQNIFGELDYLNRDLWTLERQEDAKLGKVDCYKIKATLKNGLVEILYFDKSTNLMVRSDKVENANKGDFKTTLFSKFKKFGQLTYSSEQKVGGDGNFQTMVIEDILLNEKVDENDFSPSK